MSTNSERDALFFSSAPPTYLIAASGDFLGLPALREEMRRRWAAGERPAAEEFFGRHPELSRHLGAALELIWEEFCLRRSTDGHADPEAFFQRFPAWRSELEVLLSAGPPREPAEVEADAGPRPGDRLGDFQLLAELGRGALGCVFLARQPALADRPVVLKITPCAGEEHLSLARLQHTHIVPLYAVHEEPRGLRVLCMPYFGGATLARLLDELEPIPAEAREGRHLIEALDRAGASPVSSPQAGPARPLLTHVSYVEALCWVGACLADALDYAHQRGLIHLDVKPANVLLAADATPMLLDFHLARQPLRRGDPLPASLGGTLAYMPHEQHEVMATLRQPGANVGAPVELDGRADVFALGATLYAALGGQLPVLPGVSPSLHAINPTVSVGLSDVVAKCLALEAAERYPTAAALAADLRLHLADQPLQGVANRSHRERWRKWRRRRPHGVALAVMLLSVIGAVLAVGIGLWAHLKQRQDEAHAALAEGLADAAEGRYNSAARTFRRGLTVAQGLPFQGDLKRQLGEELEKAESASCAAESRRLAADLHDLADRLRFLYGTSFGPTETQEIEARCAALWAQRASILAAVGPAGRTSASTDLLDVALLWADLRIYPGEGAASEQHRAVLRLLDEAEQLLGASHVLLRERQAHAEALGLRTLAASSAQRAEKLPPRSAWEYYALGRSLMRRQPLFGLTPATTGAAALVSAANRLAADAALRRAVALEPGGLWPNFYLGLSAYGLGRYHEAAGSFSVCIGAAPRAAVVYYNRALARALLGQEETALDDLGHALRLEARFIGQAAPVYHNLAIARLATGDRRGAIHRLEQALREDADYLPSRELLASLRRNLR